LGVQICKGFPHFRLYFLFLTAIISAFSQTPTTVQLNSFPNPAVFGQPVTLTATVSPSAAQGKVTFYSGATVLGTQVLNAGQATLTTTFLPVGKGPLTAFYPGSTEYLTSTSATLPQTIYTLPSAGLSLANGNPFLVGPYPEPVVLGDFNGDGKVDMALAEELSSGMSEIAVFLGDGNGNFTQAPGIPIVISGLARSLALADFNGDGKPDLATSDSEGDTVTVLLGDGSGKFTMAPGSPFLAGSDPFSVAAGDFNGDGNVDLAVGDYSSTNNVNIFLGNGAGGFTAAPGSPFSVGSAASSIAVADFDGDGISDLAVANAQSNNVSILLGNGTGRFTLSNPFAAGTGPWSLAVGDFNEDGKPDLAIANADGGPVTVLLQDGGGGFTPAGGDPFAPFAFSLAVGDFNGDGHLDLVAASAGYGTVEVLYGDGAGKFTPAFGGPLAVGDFPYFVAVADLNGDGLADIAVVDSSSNAVSVLLGVPGSTVQTIAFPALPVKVLGSPPFTLAASTSSGLPVSFSSADNTICTVDGAVVALVATGTCSITATQSGNAIFIPAAAVTVTFAVRASFIDVGGENSTFLAAIDEILSKGITSGCTTSPPGYCPSLNVTRGQMAVFIVRSIYGSNDFTYNPTPWFSDAVDSPATLPDGSANPNYTTFFKYIQKMKELGITAGCTVESYCPNQDVTRGEAAVFIVRARYGVNFNFDYPATPYFTDAVGSPATLPDATPNPNFTTFFRYIQRLKQDNITAGCTTTTFCPDSIVTRDQAAVFISRAAFNDLLPSGMPFIGSVVPSTGGLGDVVDIAVTGVNTTFVQGTTAVSPGAGFTVQSVTVNSPTSLTARLQIGSGAPLGPASILAITGSEEAVAPNAFTVTSNPAAGAIAWFSGNGSNVNSISGLSGFPAGTVAYASALSRTQGIPDALAFNMVGISSYLRMSVSEAVMVTGARTLVAWVNPSQAGAFGQPILTGGQTYNFIDTFGITPAFQCETAPPYRLYIDHNGTCYLSNLTLVPNTWSMVAVTFDGTNAVFYVNGVASVPMPLQMNDYNLGTFEIGGSIESLAGIPLGTAFQGLLSEVQVYGRSLTPAEIQGLYKP
jgi:Bacterial Ig-like domain (group 3)/Concanavalin A-like lectin/glucanases superfamily/FG-GAP-like repeat/S-layer homology domain